MKHTLLDITLSLCKRTKVPVSQICGVVGVSRRWYYRLLAGDYEDPGVRKIQRLHDYLSEQVSEKKEAA